MLKILNLKDQSVHKNQQEDLYSLLSFYLFKPLLLKKK